MTVLWIACIVVGVVVGLIIGSALVVYAVNVAIMRGLGW